MPLHLEKKAIRVFALAESFSETQKFSTMAGVVIRSDLIIDGLSLGKLTVSGSDAARTVLSMFKKLHRNDINAILASGSVLSLYNVLDIEAVHSATKLPVVALSFNRSKSDLAENIRRRFSARIAEKKIHLLQKLGDPFVLTLKSGYHVFVRSAGANEAVCQRLLDKFTIQGAVPEPIRVARLVARSVAEFNR